jgi:hypothetical protein
MKETIQQYKARILGHVEGKEWLQVQSTTPEVLAELIHGVNKEKLTQRPQPEKWSVAEILAHLAEAEAVAHWRYRQVLEHSGDRIVAFDQNMWAELGDYRNWPPHEALDMFRLIRQSNLRLFARLTPQQWECYGMHSERGKEVLKDYVRMMAGHDLNHVEQVRQILNS